MKGDLSLEKAIEEYRTIYLAYRNYAVRSREEYVNDLLDLTKFLLTLGIKRVGDVELPHLIRYLAELDRRGFAGSTRKRKAITIKSFFRFLHEDGYTLVNVASKLILPFVEERNLRFLTSDEIARLLKPKRTNIRDYTIIQLLLHTGIKLSELTRLTLNDLIKKDLADNLDADIGYIRIVATNRGKERLIPVSSELNQAIKGYLSERNGESEKLFLNKRGEPLGERGVEKIVYKYFEVAGIEGASVNSLRHTFGANYAAAGINKRTMQKIMGYKDVRSTSIYYHRENKIR